MSAEATPQPTKPAARGNCDPGVPKASTPASTTPSLPAAPAPLPDAPAPSRPPRSAASPADKGSASAPTPLARPPSATVAKADLVAILDGQASTFVATSAEILAQVSQRVAGDAKGVTPAGVTAAKTAVRLFKGAIGDEADGMPEAAQIRYVKGLASLREAVDTMPDDVPPPLAAAAAPTAALRERVTLSIGSSPSVVVTYAANLFDCANVINLSLHVSEGALAATVMQCVLDHMRTLSYTPPTATATAPVAVVTTSNTTTPPTKIEPAPAQAPGQQSKGKGRGGADRGSGGGGRGAKQPQDNRRGGGDSKSPSADAASTPPAVLTPAATPPSH